MDKKEFYFQQMLHEYDTLRAEAMKIYDQQMQFIFGALVTAAGAIFITLSQSQIILPGLPILLLILISVCIKSLGNYTRIYRIGAYLAVAHEQQGEELDKFVPGSGRAAYHTRWRLIPRRQEYHRRFRWVGAEAPGTEALFLSLLAIVGWGLAIGSLRETLWSNPGNIILTSLSLLLSLVLLYLANKLAGIFRVSSEYERIFSGMIREEDKRLRAKSNVSRNRKRVS